MATYFSVIIPVFNREKMITRAIESVLAQTFTDYELIIVDDGSTDKTSQIIKKYKCKILTIKNSGVSAARNTGIRESKGKWICLLDSDDQWLESKLQKQFDLIQNPDNKDAVGYI